MASVMKMVHTIDPAKEIYDKIGMKKPGELPNFKMMGNRVLLGIYNRPEKTAGGIIITETTRAEERYQGKAALVLMLGPTAFVSDDHFVFAEEGKVAVGDWVSLSVTDGRAIRINGQDCRIIRDQDISMKIASPDSVY